MKQFENTDMISVRGGLSGLMAAREIAKHIKGAVYVNSFLSEKSFIFIHFTDKA